MRHHSRCRVSRRRNCHPRNPSTPEGLRLTVHGRGGALQIKFRRLFVTALAVTVTTEFQIIYDE